MMLKAVTVKVLSRADVHDTGSPFLRSYLNHIITQDFYHFCRALCKGTVNTYFQCPWFDAEPRS
ncbi:hypothetical protein MHBO_004455 [Bonamia ostreae]|uniref:Uncharacterized protein n=1 Tax=Bonamia ostreae TaxID=126728 RepID=A0ABV2ATC9_9EUKA